MEIKTNSNLPDISKHNDVYSLIENKTKETTDEKVAINLLATKTALEQEGTIEKIVSEKTEELKNDAEAKRVEAETKRINEEVKRIKQEKEKEIAEYDKIIVAKQKEVEQLNAEKDKLEAENNKAQAYFNSNKEILKYIGIREKKSIGTMKSLMYPATIIFTIVQILLFPLTLGGILIETITNIIGSVCGAIKNNALRIVITIIVLIFVIGILGAVYFFGGKLIAKI